MAVMTETKARKATTVGLAVVLAIAGLVLLAPAPALAGPEACRAMATTVVPASEIALATTGAKVDSAAWVPASGGLPDYCRLKGEISPVDPAAPPVLFEVNLPDVWNGKTVQYGGAGLNGALVTGLGRLPDQPPTVPVPLDRGYATLGTDAGHPNAKPDIQVFALNREALLNHAFGAYKKTHDVAMALIRARYGRAPSRNYYFGHSEGGREALLVAQRYPADYDGVVSSAPVHSWTLLQLTGYEQWRALQAAGPLSPGQLKRLSAAVLEACDDLDGLRDGVVSQYRGCARRFDPSVVACGKASPDGDCLSEAQLALLRRIRAPYPLGYAAANGLTSYPPFGLGGEAQPGGYMPPLLSSLAVGDVRYFIVRDPQFSAPFDPVAYRARVIELSKLLDATDPDLSAFRARGGKLIMHENTGDYVQSPESGFAYYDSVISKMGRAATDGFVRLYVTPGANHNGSGQLADGAPLPNRIDLLSVLDAWVEGRAAAPQQLVQTAYAETAPYAPLSSRPMCSYPTYPHYKGAGNPALADSFDCRPLPGR